MVVSQISTCYSGFPGVFGGDVVTFLRWWYIKVYKGNQILEKYVVSEGIWWDFTGHAYYFWWFIGCLNVGCFNSRNLGGKLTVIVKKSKYFQDPNDLTLRAVWFSWSVWSNVAGCQVSDGFGIIVSWFMWHVASSFQSECPFWQVACSIYIYIVGIRYIYMLV